MTTRISKNARGVVALFVLGACLGWAVPARSKGQLCNPPERLGRSRAMTLTSATIGGADATPESPNAIYVLKTEFIDEPDLVHAQVFDPENPELARVVHVVREP